MTPKKRIELCIAKKLCKNCLLHNHTTEQCKLLRRCTICGDKHTKFLHVNDSNGQDESKSSVTTDLSGNMSNDVNVSSDISGNVEKKVQSYNVSVKQTNNDLVLLPAVPIVVNNTYITYMYALIDACSSQTFCSNSLVEKLGISGKKTTINLSTIENEDSSIQTDCVKLKVSDLNGSNTVVRFSSCYRLYTSTKGTNYEFLYKHLNHINPLPSDYTVDVLFGQDCPDIIKVLEIRDGGPGETYASRSVLGWSVCGPIPRTMVCYSTKSDMYREELSHNLKLEEAVQKMWTLENELSDEMSHSHEDRAVMQYWDENVSVEDNHYVVRIPRKRKQGNIRKPFVENNKLLAITRFNSLKKRLDRDLDLKEKYRKGIQDMIEKKYAE